MNHDSEFSKFDTGVRKTLSVSNDEVKRREEQMEARAGRRAETWAEDSVFFVAAMHLSWSNRPTGRMRQPESQSLEKLRKCRVEGIHDLAERPQPRLTGSPF